MEALALRAEILTHVDCFKEIPANTWKILTDETDSNAMKDLSNQTIQAKLLTKHFSDTLKMEVTTSFTPFTPPKGVAI